MAIAIWLFDDLTALDAVGPYEVLKWLPDAKVRLVAKTPGPQPIVELLRSRAQGR